jgi:hypothetical protein
MKPRGTASRPVGNAFGLVAVALGVAAASPEAVAHAHATVTHVTPFAPRMNRARTRSKIETPVSTIPDADVKLTLDAPTPRGPWTMRIINEGAVPVSVVADARLLVLDVTRRSDSRAERCELPADMRPEDTTDRALVLAAGRSYVEAFEPRLYCFSGKALRALAPTSLVVAHLGWLSKGSPEWELSPLDGVEPAVAPRKHLDSAPIFLYDEKVAAMRAPPLPGEQAPLVLSGPESVEADSPDEVAVPVTLRNIGSRALFVRFRPDTMGFEVFSPSGRELCSWPRLPAAPTPELFMRLAPKGATDMPFALAAFCDEDSLDQEGLLVVRPWLDTRAAGGQSIGITAFSGQVAAAAPTFVRLHRGRKPLPRVPPQAAPQ